VQRPQSLSPSGQAVAGSSTSSNSQSTRLHVSQPQPGTSAAILESYQSHCTTSSGGGQPTGSLAAQPSRLVFRRGQPAEQRSCCFHLEALATYTSSRHTALLMISHFPQNETRPWDLLPASLNWPHSQASNLAPRLQVSPLPLVPSTRPQTPDPLLSQVKCTGAPPHHLPN